MVSAMEKNKAEWGTKMDGKWRADGWLVTQWPFPTPSLPSSLQRLKRKDNHFPPFLAARGGHINITIRRQEKVSWQGAGRLLGKSFLIKGKVRVGSVLSYGPGCPSPPAFENCHVMTSGHWVVCYEVKGGPKTHKDIIQCPDTVVLLGHLAPDYLLNK